MTVKLIALVCNVLAAILTRPVVLYGDALMGEPEDDYTYRDN